MQLLSLDSRGVCVLPPELLGCFQMVLFEDPTFLNSALVGTEGRGGEMAWGEVREPPSAFPSSSFSSFQALPKFSQEPLAP